MKFYLILIGLAISDVSGCLSSSIPHDSAALAPIGTHVPRAPQVLLSFDGSLELRRQSKLKSSGLNFRIANT